MNRNLLAILILLGGGMAVMVWLAFGLGGRQEPAPAPQTTVQAPATQAPATQAPATQAPATQAPATPAAPAPATPAPQQAAPAPAAQAPAATVTPEAAREAAQNPLVDRVLGNPNAPVTILDYSSMTCPHCATFHTEVLPKLKEQYIDTGKAKLIFRDFPFDRAALYASMLARCAPPERYYGMLDVLFKAQGQWSRAQDPQKALAQIGKLAGMSQQTIDACFANQPLADGLLSIRMDGEKTHKVESTPTFILNDGAAKVVGAQPVEEFAKAIDKLVK